jgi:hypothetical protein
MDRMKRNIAATLCASLAAALALASCPQPLELRAIVDQRVAVANAPALPRIALVQGAAAVLNGGTLDIGSVQASGTKDISFSISNSGDAALVLGGDPLVAVTGANQAEFSIQASPATPIAAGGESAFTLRFSPSSAGSKTAILTITNNTLGDSTFSFTVTAAATVAPAPAIQVAQGSAAVAANATVDLGRAVAGDTIDIPFSITNSGDAPLVLSAAPGITGANATDFSVQALSATTIAPGASASFAIRFSPAAAGAKSATVAIASNAAAFTFALAATGDPADTQGPTGSVLVAGGAAYSQGLNVALTLSAVDLGGGTVAQMEVRNDSAFTGNWQSYATTLPWTLAGPDGANTVYVRFRDNSGNNSGTYSDAIILDRVDPTITVRSPASGAGNITRSNNIVVTFSENIDPATITGASFFVTQGANNVAGARGSATTTATLNPDVDLKFGYQYGLTLGSAIKDLSGRSISNPGTTYFTVEDDVYENPNGNQSSANAFDLTYGSPANLVNGQFPGEGGGVAILKDFDYYKIHVEHGVDLWGTLNVRAYFSDASGNIQAAGTDDLRMGVTNGGAGLGARQTIIANATNDRSYSFDLLSPSLIDGDFYIVVYQNASYANLRTYNLVWSLTGWYGM